MEATASRPAPEAVAPPPGHPRFPLFDAIRAFAALTTLAITFVCAALSYYLMERPLMRRK